MYTKVILVNVSISFTLDIKFKTSSMVCSGNVSIVCNLVPGKDHLDSKKLKQKQTFGIQSTDNLATVCNISFLQSW